MQSKSHVAGRRPRPIAAPPTAAQATVARSVARSAAGQAPAAQAARIHLLGIDERSSGVDPVLANVFQTMRASVGLPPGDLVRVLRTRPEVLANLEAGRVRALPPLPETVRLIKDYGALLHIDIEPILSRIKEQTGEKRPPLTAARATLGNRIKSIIHLALPARAQRQVAAPPSLRTVPKSIRAEPAAQSSTEKAARRPGRRLRALVTAGISTALLMGAVWTAQSQPSTFYAAVDQLPPGLAKSLRRGLEMISLSLTSSRDGLTWIEANDPRRRKADKLPVNGPER